MSTKRIQSLVTHYFAEPRPMPINVTIAMASGAKVLDNIGKLHVLSPAEFNHAFLMAMHGSLASGDDSLMERWKNAALSTAFKFQICEGEDARHFAEKQLREDFGASYVGVRQTALAKVFELVKFRTRKEITTGKLNHTEVAQLYSQNVKFSEANNVDGNSEVPTSATFVESATSVHKRILSIPRCREMLLHADESIEGNPLDSVSKLIVLATRAKTADCIEWAAEHILDFVRSGALAVEQVGCRALEGKLAGQQGRGLVDLCLYKRGLLSHLSNNVLGKLDWSDDIKGAMRDSMTSITAFRNKCGYLFTPSMPPVSLAWRAGWPRSAEQFMTLVEALVFWYQYDSCVRASMVNRRDLTTLVSTSPISDELEEIENAIKEEHGTAKPDAAEEAPAADDEPTVDLAATLESNPEVQKLSKNIEDKADTAGKQKLNAYLTQARRLISSHIQLVAETDNDDIILKGGLSGDDLTYDTRFGVVGSQSMKL